MKYLEEAKELWAKYVPREGQADTQQGEMVRAVERLRDEALRNGNGNWGPGYERLGEYLRRALTSADCFSASEKEEINSDVDIILNWEYPQTADEPYDRLLDRVVEWTHAHPEPVPREHVP